MSFRYSKVTAEHNGRTVEFLTCGTPHGMYDLKGYGAFDKFMMGVNKGEIVDVHVDSYLYGEGEQSRDASPVEVAMMETRQELCPDAPLDGVMKVRDFNYMVQKID